MLMNAPRKRSGKLTYRQYCQIPGDGYRYEIIDGSVFKNPAPSPNHQTVSSRIHFQLYSQIELTGKGRVFYAPVDVELGKHDIAQPDLVVLIGDKVKLVTRSRIQGVPDLVVEVLSPSRPEYDLVTKKAMYERVRVPEYWIVDPEASTLLQLVLQRGKFTRRRPTRYVRPTGIDGVTLDLKQIWQCRGRSGRPTRASLQLRGRPAHLN